jgi:pimeloyl-ACP methyl ester carboxylesterase
MAGTNVTASARIPGGAFGPAGHGQSSGPLVGSITACARLVDKFLGCLALPRPLIAVGHSMGAAIALTLALNHADHVDGLVLVGAGARMRVLPAFLDALGKGQSNPDFIRLAFSPHTSADIVNTEVASFSAVDTAVLFNDFSACNSFDISSRLTAINLPTLILVGEDDRLTPVKYSHSLNENISGAQLLIIPQAGHMAMLEKGAEVSKAIKEFTDRW